MLPFFFEKGLSLLLIVLKKCVVTVLRLLLGILLSDIKSRHFGDW